MKKTLRILHYALGFPPARTGGQTWYVLDLLQQQVAAGHTVACVYPESLNPLVRRAYIKPAQTGFAGLIRFGLVNSLPLPLFGGIRQPRDFCKPSDMGIFLRLFEDFQPDVIHIHTLMGLYREFMLAAKQCHIPVIFTSHDYFGLSPVPDFYFSGRSWHNDNSTEFWCNVGMNRAMSTSALRVFQLGIYPQLRDFLKRLRGARPAATGLLSQDTHTWDKKYISNMEALHAYYQDIFSMITRFHFNSTIARDVYQYNLLFELKSFDLVPVTNSSVMNYPISERLTNSPKRVSYIGPYLEYKGFFDFFDLAHEYTNSDLEFHLWGDDRKIISPKVINHGRFRRDDIDRVFSSIDVLIFPSRWQETFGLVAIEALDHGVPVLASCNAGIKDLLPTEWIFNSKEELLKQINNAPTSVPRIVRSKLKTMMEHEAEIAKIYRKAVWN
ncbi:MAG: glycosyltransferase [Azoarcus sp.]|jgi:glycosyltransferase involved in cell wall biosynthesis|nr:glycosyltransferase [Azoarcus sp.]